MNNSLTIQENTFQRICLKHGLDPSDLGEVFQIKNGERYRIVGATDGFREPHRQPILSRRESDGLTFAFPASLVKTGLKVARMSMIMTPPTTNAITPVVREHIRDALSAIELAQERMLRLSGGESGRDFSRSEQLLWDHLVMAKVAVAIVDRAGDDSAGYNHRDPKEMRR